MSEDFGPTFITVTDDEGNEIVLEFVDALEHNGQMYQAFFPAETEGEEDDPDNGLVILKVIHEDGEDLLSTLDSDEELDTVYDLFMEPLFSDEDGEGSSAAGKMPCGVRNEVYTAAAGHVFSAGRRPCLFLLFQVDFRNSSYDFSTCTTY